jgi:hypothetical protein
MRNIARKQPSLKLERFNITGKFGPYPIVPLMLLCPTRGQHVLREIALIGRRASDWAKRPVKRGKPMETPSRDHPTELW